MSVLHNKQNDPIYQGLPENPKELYKELSTVHIGTIKKLRKKGILKDDQLEILLPKNGDYKTYSKAFDVTLLAVLIINCTTLPPPVNGWNQKVPLDSDTSIAANVLRAREWRNFLNHVDANVINTILFQSKWKEGVDIIQGLGGTLNDLVKLKTISLDPRDDVVNRSLMDFNRRKIAHLEKKVNNLEDKTDKMDGEIKQTKENNVKLNDKVDGNTKQIEENQNQIIHTLQIISSLKDEQSKILKETRGSIGIYLNLFVF